MTEKRQLFLGKRRRNQKLVELLFSLAEQGKLNAQILVNMARDKKSSLHDLFEWNNDIAGEKYRLVQARMIINNIKIIMEDKEVSAFENILVEANNNEKLYKPIYMILDTEKERQQLIERALREINYWKMRYQMLNEFKPVFKAIENIKLSGYIHGKSQSVGARSGQARKL